MDVFSNFLHHFIPLCEKINTIEILCIRFVSNLFSRKTYHLQFNYGQTPHEYDFINVILRA